MVNILRLSAESHTQQEFFGVIQFDWMRVVNVNPPGGCRLGPQNDDWHTK